MNDKTEFTQESEVLASGSTTVKVRRELKHTHIELNIVHRAEDHQLCGEKLLSQIRAAFKAPPRGSHRWETLDLKLDLIRKLFNEIKSTFHAVEAEERTNDFTLLTDFSRVLNECSCVFLPILTFDLDAYRLVVESMLECIRRDNEPESEPHQIDLLPISPPQPISPCAASTNATVTKPLQKSGDSQNAKPNESRGGISPTLKARLHAFGQRNGVAETNSHHTEAPLPIKP